MNGYNSCSGCGNGCDYSKASASLADSIMADMKAHADGASHHQEDYLSKAGYQNNSVSGGYHRIAAEEQRPETRETQTHHEGEKQSYNRGQNNIDSAVRQVSQDRMPGFPDTQRASALSGKKRTNSIDDAIAKAQETDKDVIFLN